jgi:lysophospholipase L1-like esterase
VLTRLKSTPYLPIIGVAVGLLVAGGAIALRTSKWSSQASETQAVNRSTAQPSSAGRPPAPQRSKRHKFTYAQWVNLLEQEVKAIAQKPTPHLTVLTGDSLSLWFPDSLLPAQRTWLNQGISGETTLGLLRRLDLLKELQPETIFIMIGINDLIQGKSNDTIVANYTNIVEELRRNHPNSQLVVQSILPHADKNTLWEGRDRLLKVPNERIQQLNTRLQRMAADHDVAYLDLYGLFADAQGNMQPALTTDGLHLSQQGYWVWRTALELHHQMSTNPVDP